MNNPLRLKSLFISDYNFTLNVKQCDLLTEQSDVIVNASNTDLFLGLGISGAIRREGGKSIQNELNKIKEEKKSIYDGDVVLTDKGTINNVKLKKIFHAVGPRFSDYENRDDLLKKTFYNCLVKAEENKFSSISIPPISSGIFRYPLKTVCSIFYKTVGLYVIDKIENGKEFLLREINFCNNLAEGYDLMSKTINEFEQYLKKYNIEYKCENLEEQYIQSQFPSDDNVAMEVDENPIIIEKVEKKNETEKININPPARSNKKKKQQTDTDNSNFKITHYFNKK